jgi:hypothetical protein
MTTTLTPAGQEEFLRATRALGEGIAIRTAHFLQKLNGWKPTPENPIALPAEFLLGIGLASQLARWSTLAPTALEGTELPGFETVLHTVMTRIAGAELQRYVIELLSEMTTVFHERFLWSAELEGLVLEIDGSADDVVLEQIADFLLLDLI